MAQKIDLNLVEQINKRTGELEWFRIEVKIDNENNSSKIYRRYLVHSVPESLESSLDQWKETFSQIVNPRSRKNSTTAIEENLSQVVDEDDDDGITIDDDNYEEDLPQVVDEDDDDGITIDDDDDEEEAATNSQDEEDTRPNCWESYLNLTTKFNNWLKSERWLKVSDLLTEYLDNSGEISVTIQTDNALLKQLPWQEWEFFQEYEYSKIEIAISPPEYEPPPGWKNIKRHPQVRILVILGDSDNINTDRDSDLLNEVRKYGGNPKFLAQPTLEELKTELTEKKGWNIIFYSGHSKTNKNGQGVLYLNKSDKIGITIDDIEEELKVAIEQGLYLAIFNSCDGLGIANRLAELRFPQSIVMKESIPDKMAIDFLKYFLKSFSRDEALFVAVGKARKGLKKEYNKPDKYPGGHSLPVIVPNPAVPLPTWKSFLSEYQLPLQLRLFGMLGVFGLPLSIICEFGLEKFLWYAKLYPHMIIYPMCAFWAVIWSVCQGWGQIINKYEFKWVIPIVLLISIIVTCIEVTSPNMLLFEVSQSAQSSIKVSAIKGELNSIKEIPLEIVNTRELINEDKIIINKPTLEQALLNYLKLKDNNKITESQVIGFHNFMTLGLNFNTTWKGRKNWVSISRWFYAYTFLLIVFTILIFIVLWGQVQEPRKFFNQNKYMQHLVFSQAMTLLWIPFRLYYVNEPKDLIFNSNNLQGFQPLEPFVFIILFLLFVSTTYNIYKQQKKNWILIIITLVIILLSFIIGAQTQLLSLLFGLNTIDERIWILFFITTGLCIYLFFNYKSSK
ncbi:MAG: CHAT domain-containing protein [Trichodesmium sp. MAG_R02]|jgi:hypothetical protein|nr:CHAT domain-containing protein [Trichodesmium sp. MAG_R02]